LSHLSKIEISILTTPEKVNFKNDKDAWQNSKIWSYEVEKIREK
jgi:hypothetical protein